MEDRMITQMEYREQAVRLLAMSLVADDATRAGRLACLSAMAQADAGIALTNDDPEVVALVEEFKLEEQQEWDAQNRPERSEDRCPVRE
jgi:hypothetical protein